MHIDTDKAVRLLALGWLFTKKQFTTRNKTNYMDENEINTKAQISKFSTRKQEMRGAFLKEFL